MLVPSREIVQGERDLATVSNLIMSELAPLVNAQYGVFYVTKREEDETKLELSFDIDNRVQIHDTAAIPLSLILAELVSNAFKHAFPDGRKASLAVELKQDGDNARLRISDNGVGFDPRAEHPQGIGLKTIRDRVSLLQGTKAYGAHVHPIPVPARERHPLLNFTSAILGELSTK